MSSIIILFILLINYIDQTINSNSCDLLSAIDLQSATYSHSLILRVQSFNSSEEIEDNLLTRKVLVREVLKISKHQININDMILIRIVKGLAELFDDSCWHLLEITTVDSILFLNDTNINELNLRYPPVESTLRVRQNIDAVINYETYSPQVIIKTRIGKPSLSKNYSMQCNARGNPLPRLIWSKNNQTLESYSSTRQCKTSCRIYSIQNKYQSILYFQSLIQSDSGNYVCHAENALNHTMSSIYINVDQTNVTCDNLKFCGNQGQCISIDNQLKCLCDNRYFGEHCETNYDEIIKKQNNTILLFKSRFLAGCILFLVGFILILIIFVSYVLTRHTSKAISKRKIDSPGGIITKESATTTENEQEQEVNVEPKTNHLILSEGYLEFYQPDAESGLIRPLTPRKDSTKHYTKYVSFHNRFLLPRPANRS